MLCSRPTLPGPFNSSTSGTVRERSKCVRFEPRIAVAFDGVSRTVLGLRWFKSPPFVSSNANQFLEHGGFDLLFGHR